MAQEYNSGSHSTDDLIRLSYFTDIGTAISRTQSLKETLDEVMKQIGKVFAPRNWSLLLRNPKTGELTFTVVIGNKEVVERLRGMKVSGTSGIAGWISSHAQPLIIEDVDNDERFDPSIDEQLNFKTRSIIGVPLKSGDRVFGVIELINKLDGEAFTALDLKLLSTIADFTAIAVEKAYYMKALKKIATIDHLTGVYNRRTCLRILDREISRCHRHQSHLATLMIDIDRFKEINDTHGHAAGDEVLKGFAELVSRCTRKVDYVCRYGGDEFVIILPDADEGTGDEVRDRIREAVERNNVSTAIPYSVSIGSFTGCPENTTELFDQADVQLYEEKDRQSAGGTHTLSTDAGSERTIEEVTDHLEEFINEDDENSSA